MKLIDDEYYIKFEGEEEIDFIYEKNKAEISRMKIWHGYFYFLLNGMITKEKKLIGLLDEHNKHEGWYESDEPWEIPDIKQAIEQFNNYSENNYSENEKPSEGILLKLPHILEKILKFLEEAKENNGKVYIEYL